MKRRGTTAAELMQRLNADPGFVARRAEKEARRLQHHAALRDAERPVRDDLLAAGMKVESVWDLVNSDGDYEAFLPILVKHLTRLYPDPVREGIARALAVPKARAFWGALKDAYLLEGDGRVKDGLAAALAAASDETKTDELIDLARRSENGPSRIMLLSAIWRSRRPSAATALLELRTDPALSAEIEAIMDGRAEGLGNPDRH